MSKAGIANIYKGGFYKTFRAIFPVRKEAGESPMDLRANIRRKLEFDMGICSLKELGGFGIRTAGLPEPFASGVGVLQISKTMDRLLWLRLGERCYDVEIKLGEDRRLNHAGETFLGYKDYSHVTEEMIRQALQKFLGRIHQTIPCTGVREGVTPRKPAICHEIRLEAFEPPMLKLHIRCGAGFWAKSFVYDLASELGTVGYPASLHRVSQGPFTYEDALPSYAISWENCNKVAEKYADRLRTYNYEMRTSCTKEDMKPYMSEKRWSKTFYKERHAKNRVADSEDESDSDGECENV